MVEFLILLPNATIAARESRVRAPRLNEVIATAAQSVVIVETYNEAGEAIAQGSGFIARPNGAIITNLHVLEGADSVIVKLSNGALFPVEAVIGTREEWDLVALKVDGKNLPALPFLSSSTLSVGDRILTIGSPQGLENTVSEGIVSALRPVEESQYRVIQITAPISSGNSGGPLLDSRGRVVGVTTFLVEGQNLNFAIPIDVVAELLDHPESTTVEAAANENNAQLLYAAGILSRDSGDYVSAEKLFKETIRIDPKYVNAYRELADYHYRRSSFTEEIDLRKKVIEITPKDAAAHLALGVALESVGEELKAVEEYERALELNPILSDASYNLTFLQILHGNLREAEAELKRLKKLNERFAEQLQRLIVMLRGKGCK